MKQVNLFAEETQLERLSKLGDSLERLKIIDFESFRPILTDGLKKERKSNAGRHPFDNVMMFKVLVLEKLFNLDSNEFENFFNEQDEVGYADSAYIGKKLPEHIRNEVCEKGYRNKPLTEEQKENNRRKSKIRCRIEHVFGFMTMSMHGLTVRSIGIARATFHIGLTNLVYNLCRYSFLIRKEAVTG